VRRREHFRGFLAIFLVAQLSPKRGVLVHKNLLASCQRCRHSVEPRALTCPVSKKWVIVMDRRQDLNVTSTPAGKSGPSAQDRYCATGFGGGAKNRRANEKK